MFISKKKHERIVKELLQRQNLFDQYERLRESYKKNNDDLAKVLNRLVDKTTSFDITLAGGNCTMTNSDIMSSLDDSVPRYVEDYFGGKVIKQEATPVTILDDNGKATYGLTKEAPDKGKRYQLIEKAKEF